MFNKSLFIFRRDLRLFDNTGLYNALSESKIVIPIFIFDPRQVGKNNDYRSERAIQFMIESLNDLDEQLKKYGTHLYVFYGKAEEITKKLIKQENIDAIFFNKDYTPFSIKRDTRISELCIKQNVACFQIEDLLLTTPDTILNSSGDPYTLFTPFYKKAFKEIDVPKPKKLTKKNFFTGPIKGANNSEYFKKFSPKKQLKLAIHGGRSTSLKILKNIKKFKMYPKTRDFPAIDTTLLSGHNKFGTVSIREVYWSIADAFGRSSILARQLYWRDFFTHVAYNFPYVFGGPFRKKYAKLQWSKSKKNFERWRDGTTGFPIVDAGMRQMNETGWMHNRARMIVASFLTKDLHLNWLWGEKYFAQKLLDYDPSVNNGNWQWTASTGTDAQPYFRIFNPWLQQKKLDPQCEYIKKWIPELRKLHPKQIHNWYKKQIKEIDYPTPMVDHKKQAEIAKKMYKNAS
jgi:deoxyribodipyrimidine photo-lyase